MRYLKLCPPVTLPTADRTQFSFSCRKQVSSLVVSSSGERLGVGCIGGAVQWLDTTSKSVVHLWEHLNDIHTLALDAADSVIAAGGADCSVTLYSLETGNKLYRFRDASPIHSVSLGEYSALVLELEDGQLSGSMRSVQLASGGVLTSRRGEFAEIKLEGIILNRADMQGSTDAWVALHDALNNSARLTTAFVLLVLFSSSVFLLAENDQISRADAKKVDYTISVLLIIECCLRIVSHARATKSVSGVFKNPLNLVDFGMAIIDAALLGVSVANEISTSAINLGGWSGWQLLKTLRLLRIVRVCRFAQVVASSDQSVVEGNPRVCGSLHVGPI